MGLSQKDSQFFSDESTKPTHHADTSATQNEFDQVFDDEIVADVRERAHTVDALSMWKSGDIQRHRHLSEPAVVKEMIEPTLMNTKAALSMPGFLSLQFNNDLRLEKTVAEGGGGVIYQAELLDDSLRRKYRIRRVAVKVLKSKLVYHKLYIA